MVEQRRTTRIYSSGILASKRRTPHLLCANARLESRNDPKNAPLSLYLGGGPGTTSLGGVTAENGPCTINPDSNSTTLNPWSWNNNVNMLYIDQPVQVGFSYDELVPSILDLLTGSISSINGSVEENGTSISGVFPSQSAETTANTTANAARIMWHFAQIWLQEFPEHQSSNDLVSIWANSVCHTLPSRSRPIPKLTFAVWRPLGSLVDGALCIAEPQDPEQHY